MTTPGPLPRYRALAPDLARGFMLLFIAVANSSWYLYSRPTSAASNHPADGNVLDRALQAVTIVAIDGRIYPMFAFLFGYGMVQFTSSRLATGIDYPSVRRMLRRRHWAMVLLGFVHAALLWMGDILGAYGVLGLLLVWWAFGRRDRTLKVWVGILVALMLLMAAFTVGAGWWLVQNPGILAQAQGTDAFAADWREWATGTPNYLEAAGFRLLM